MRISIRDGYGMDYTITSRDFDLIARWIVQTLIDIEPSPELPAMIQAWPSVTPHGAPDWVTDSRVLGTTAQVRTPREAVEYLAEQVARAEKLAGR